MRAEVEKNNYKRITRKFKRGTSTKESMSSNPLYVHFQKLFGEENGNRVTIIYNPQFFKIQNTIK